MQSHPTSPTGTNVIVHRRHAADETANLLSTAVIHSIRTIAFCKTRSLVEWVYERTVHNLKSNPATSHLAHRVESYRGGYTAETRRSIESKLFQNEIWGVVGTSALELGVDIGGIDLTLHCGYPGSISSVLQQSGRAGRGGGGGGAGAGGHDTKPSFAIMVAFGSPCEQHLWKHPRGLLGKGFDVPPSVSREGGIVRGHMLCAGEEFPLTGSKPVSSLLGLGGGDGGGGAESGCIDSTESSSSGLLTDVEVFGGSDEVYTESIDLLREKGLVRKETVAVAGGMLPQIARSHTEACCVTVFKTHPFVEKPWARVSLRSIEPISYSIVDTTHPLQGGRTDTIHEKAILDTIPYSRVFYHAFPGAIIMHRGMKYKVFSMHSPPPFLDCSTSYRHQSGSNLGAFAKPSNARYSTKAMNNTKITVVKQLERIELARSATREQMDGNDGMMDGASKGTATTHKKDESLCAGVADPGESRASDSKEKGSAKNQLNEPVAPVSIQPIPELTLGPIAGNGVVNVKRTVHGYKKLSLVTRAELSRVELSVPPMEFDTNALWIDAEAAALLPVLEDYEAGVHALSHALLAVAPLFVPCTSSDLDCDHSTEHCTRVLLFDVRAGGAGTTAQLWKHFFRPDGMLDAAIDLLQDCPSCRVDGGYEGGCPGCIQSVPCIKFNAHLSRSAGLVIARRMLRRLQQSKLYQGNNTIVTSSSLKGSLGSCMENTEMEAPLTPERKGSRRTQTTTPPGKDTSPRRRARAKALHNAKDLVSARKRDVVVGRPTWPMDEEDGVVADNCFASPCKKGTGSPLCHSPGGFIAGTSMFQ